MALGTISVQLRSFDVGPWKFSNLSTIEGCSSLLLEYQYPSEILTVKVLSRDLATLAGSFSVCGISAQLVSLAYDTPGYMVSMHVKLLLEVKSVHYVEFDFQSAVNNSDRSNTVTSGERSAGHSPSDAIERKLRCHLVTLTADPVESANLRDIVQLCVEEDQQLRGTNFVNKDASNSGGAFASAIPLAPISEEVDGLHSETRKRRQQLNREMSVFDSCIPPAAPEQARESKDACLVPTLPFWAPYIPWWLYSRPLRTTIQLVLLLYLVFSMTWALWQLHRHFYIIQAAIAPIIAILRRFVAPILHFMDHFLASFTPIWVQLINPVCILLGTLFTPAIRIVRILWQASKPLVQSPLVKTVFVPFFTVLLKPLTCVWSLLAKTRLSLTSLDEVKMRVSLVLNLVVGSVKSIWAGILRLLRYSQDVQKQKKAMETIQPGGTPRTHMEDIRRRLSQTPKR